ncbi:hypothetical protein D3C76_1608350 [compost metagenome]
MTAVFQCDTEPFRLAIEQVAVTLYPAVLHELRGVVAYEQVGRTQQLVVAHVGQEIGLHEHHALAVLSARAGRSIQHLWYTPSQELVAPSWPLESLQARSKPLFSKRVRGAYGLSWI